MYPGSELTFVNLQNPNDVVEPSLRHRIRSRAAFHTHECRLKSTLPLQLSRSEGQFNVLVPRYTPRKEGSISKQLKFERERLRSASTVAQDEIDAAVRRDALGKRLSTLFANAPVPHEPWHADAFDAWNNDAYPKYWDLTDIERMTGIKYHDYQSWMQRASITDPTIYYVELLAGITNAYQNAGQGTRRRLFVEAELCREINNALDDPDRRLSTPTLIAIARLLFHEFFLGNRETALRVHLPGLQRMLEMKGGEQGFRQDAPHMIVDLFRLHAWIVVQLCDELGMEQLTELSGSSTELADRIDQAEGGSHVKADPCVKLEEPAARVWHPPHAFLRQIAWQPCEAKLQQQYQPGNAMLSFWTTTDTVRDYPTDFAITRRHDAHYQDTDSLAPEKKV